MRLEGEALTICLLIVASSRLIVRGWTSVSVTPLPESKRSALIVSLAMFWLTVVSPVLKTMIGVLSPTAGAPPVQLPGVLQLSLTAPVQVWVAKCTRGSSVSARIVGGALDDRRRRCFCGSAGMGR